MRCGKRCALAVVTTLILIAIAVIMNSQKNMTTPDTRDIVKITNKAGSQEGLETRSEKLDEPDMLLEVRSLPGTGCEPEHVFSDAELLALPQFSFTTHHTWASKDTVDTFSGPLLRDVLKAVCPDNKKPLKLHMRAMDGYAIDVDFPAADKFKPTLALFQNGERMKIRNMGHIWLMAPLDEFTELQEEPWMSF
ncbi:MAG: hypothetical protein R3E95_16640 [Thiolinea sp.]